MRWNETLNTTADIWVPFPSWLLGQAGGGKAPCKPFSRNTAPGPWAWPEILGLEQGTWRIAQTHTALCLPRPRSTHPIRHTACRELCLYPCSMNIPFMGLEPGCWVQIQFLPLMSCAILGK